MKPAFIGLLVSEPDRLDGFYELATLLCLTSLSAPIWSPRDAEGKPYTVRYDAVNAMLLNEFLKQHRTVRELKSAVAKQ